MLLLGLKRPQKNMKNFKYHSSNSFSCMILSVENLHSVVNRKEATHTDICYNYQRINKISNKVECALFHKHRKMISFAKISGTIKRLEISKTKVQACGNSSKFRPETWNLGVSICQQCMVRQQIVAKKRLWQEQERFQKMLILKSSHQCHNRKTTMLSWGKIVFLLSVKRCHD